VTEARCDMTNWYDRRVARFKKEDKEVGSISKYCVMWAYFTAKAMTRMGLRSSQIQAGTAYWTSVPKELDDGVVPNIFGYEYTPGPSNFLTYTLGLMPEMHCWVGCVDPPLIVDLTPTYFKKNAEEAGYVWKAPDPPSYLWCDLRDEPVYKVIYAPHPEAIVLAYRMVNDMIGGGM
jgi:hypothetical protein